MHTNSSLVNRQTSEPGRERIPRFPCGLRVQPASHHRPPISPLQGLGHLQLTCTARQLALLVLGCSAPTLGIRGTQPPLAVVLDGGAHRCTNHEVTDVRVAGRQGCVPAAPSSSSLWARFTHSRGPSPMAEGGGTGAPEGSPGARSSQPAFPWATGPRGRHGGQTGGWGWAVLGGPGRPAPGLRSLRPLALQPAWAQTLRSL